MGITTRPWGLTLVSSSMRSAISGSYATPVTSAIEHLCGIHLLRRPLDVTFEGQPSTTDSCTRADKRQLPASPNRITILYSVPAAAA